MAEPARGVQQDFNLDLFCYNAGSLNILEELRANPPMPGPRAVSFIVEIVAILLPEFSLNYWPCAGGLSAVNAIGTQWRDPIN